MILGCVVVENFRVEREWVLIDFRRTLAILVAVTWRGGAYGDGASGGSGWRSDRGRW